MAKKKEETKAISKKSKAKEIAEFLACAALIVYGIGSLAGFIGGVSSSGEYKDYRSCYDKPSRLIGLFPTFTLGCYLGAPSDQEYYNYATYKEVTYRDDMEWRVTNLRNDLTWYKNREKFLMDKLDTCYEDKKRK